MSHAYGPGPRFPSINQGPTGMAEPMAPNPPGFYMGWPLASLPKRCMSGFLDYGLFLFLALIVASVIAAVVRAVAGENAGAAASLILLIAAYCAALYNFSVLQSRMGQSWGKGIVGLRAVRMFGLTPPGKLILGLKPFFSMLEIMSGVGLVAILFSRHHQTLSDKFCDIVVIDEHRTGGFTLPWVVPGEPVMAMAPPTPQGAVPRPKWKSSRVRETAPADDPTIDADYEPEAPAAQPDDDDLPEFPTAPTQPQTAPPPAQSAAPQETAADDDTDDGDEVVDWTGADGETAKGDEQSTSDGPRYFGDPAIAEAIRAGDMQLAHQQAQQALGAAFDRDGVVDIADAVAEYRAVIAKQGKAIRPTTPR